MQAVRKRGEGCRRLICSCVKGVTRHDEVRPVGIRSHGRPKHRSVQRRISGPLRRSRVVLCLGARDSGQARGQRPDGPDCCDGEPLRSAAKRSHDRVSREALPRSSPERFVPRELPRREPPERVVQADAFRTTRADRPLRRRCPRPSAASVRTSQHANVPGACVAEWCLLRLGCFERFETGPDGRTAPLSERMACEGHTRGTQECAAGVPFSYSGSRECAEYLAVGSPSGDFWAGFAVEVELFG